LGKDICIAALVLIAAMIIILPEADALSRKSPDRSFLPDRILVKFHEGVGPEVIARIVESENGTVIRIFTSTGVYLIGLNEGVSPANAVKEFISHKEVEYAEPVVRSTPLESK